MALIVLPPRFAILKYGEPSLGSFLSSAVIFAASHGPFAGSAGAAAGGVALCAAGCALGVPPLPSLSLLQPAANTAVTTSTIIIFRDDIFDSSLAIAARPRTESASRPYPRTRDASAGEFPSSTGSETAA